jgi:hypothetical protein
MKKILFYIVTVIFILLIPIIGSEIYLRYIGLGKPITYDDNYVFGYAPKPNQKTDRFDDSTITINDVGLRSIHNWEENKEINKIVFYGDSVTYGGSYIDDKETFSYLVCENLEIKFICGNAGVNSYGIHNVVYRSRYDSRIALSNLRVFIIVPDDFYRGLQNYKTAHFYMNNKKFMTPAIFEAINFLSTKYNLNNFISKRTDAKGEKNIKNLIDESVDLLLSEFERLKKSNKKFLIFYSPGKNKSELDTYIYNNFFNKSSFEIIDLSDSLDESMYIDSVHYNKIGHQKISEEITNRILKMN